MTHNQFISDPAIPWVEIRMTEDSKENYKNHSHPQLSVGMVTHGTVMMTIHQQSYSVQTGTLVVIGPNTVHSCNPSSGSRSYQMLTIDAKWSHELQQALLGQSEGLRLPENPVINNHKLFQQGQSLLNSLKLSGFSLEKSEQLIHFVGDLLLFNAQTAIKHQSDPPDAVARLKTMLSQALDENQTLQDLATKIGSNPYSLLRNFKRHVGLTPHEFRLNLRIEHAKKLLRSGLPPAAVAAETGFVDQSHFHRTFRQFVAATPRQYQLRR